MDKVCTKCGRMKFAHEFPQNKKSADGLNWWCKECTASHARNYRRENPEKARESIRQWALRNPEHAASIKRRRGWRNQGIDVVEAERLLAREDLSCEICGHKWLPGKRRLAVDHDHKTGKVRGLLCSRCNRSLARFNDDPDLLERAAAYLRKS